MFYSSLMVIYDYRLKKYVASSFRVRNSPVHSIFLAKVCVDFNISDPFNRYKWVKCKNVYSTLSRNVVNHNPIVSARC